ncbi:GrpB family protein [Labrenzia sp. DG1229]|uniref:GrpB family protein n=1 Tax=Labrenzia sp. DG1229 TaxID=681847 RepID=UPI000490EB19|nr:GrpB family protein [Labrenzia sp. DG1229]
MAIKLFSHDPDWIKQAGLLIFDPSRLLGDNASRIDHVGSTAVPGLTAKPKLHIDITLRPDIEPVSLCPPFYVRSYANPGFVRREGEIQPTRPAGRRMFPCPPGERSTLMAHRLCLCRAGHTAPKHRRDFRDALRRDPVIAANYQQLKQELVARFGPAEGRERYNSGKTSFITNVLSQRCT